MYPLNQEKYTNIDYYKKSQISLAIERKTEQKINKSMKPVLFQFQQRGIYKADLIKKSLKSLPENFDMNCEYLEMVNFDSSVGYLNIEYDA